jgi:hypothetical protein
MKSKIINLLKSLDYNNYLKTYDNRNIDIEKKENKFDFENNQITKTDLFDKNIKNDDNLNPPDWDLIPPYENVRMVNK